MTAYGIARRMQAKYGEGAAPRARRRLDRYSRMMLDREVWVRADDAGRWLLWSTVYATLMREPK